MQKKEKLHKSNGEHELKIQELEYRLNELQTEAAELRAKVRTNLLLLMLAFFFVSVTFI